MPSGTHAGATNGSKCTRPGQGIDDQEVTDVWRVRNACVSAGHTAPGPDRSRLCEKSDAVRFGRPGEPAPHVPEAELDALVERHGDDLRAIHAALYDHFQRAAHGEAVDVAL